MEYSGIQQTDVGSSNINEWEKRIFVYTLKTQQYTNKCYI